jgi:hypothetical protein
VANRLQDTMGFTVVGPDHFLGSGHPDVRDTKLYQPGRRPLLGLIESRDAGRSWQLMRGQVGLLLDWERPDALSATTDDGQLWHSKEAGASWRQAGKLSGRPEAFLAHNTSLYVAVAQLGIVTSTDQGRSWRVLYRDAPPAG